MLSFITGLFSAISANVIGAYWAIAESGLVLIVLAIAAIVLRTAAAVPFVPPQFRGFMLPLSWLCFACLFINIGHRLADERASTAQLRFDLTFKETQLANAAATAAAKTRLADELHGTIDDINKKVADYEKQLESQPLAPAVCNDHVARTESDFLRQLAKGRAKRPKLSFIDRLRGLGLNR